MSSTDLLQAVGLLVLFAVAALSVVMRYGKKKEWSENPKTIY